MPGGAVQHRYAEGTAGGGADQRLRAVFGYGTDSLLDRRRYRWRSRPHCGVLDCGAGEAEVRRVAVSGFAERLLQKCARWILDRAGKMGAWTARFGAECELLQQVACG